MNASSRISVSKVSRFAIPRAAAEISFGNWPSAAAFPAIGSETASPGGFGQGATASAKRCSSQSPNARQAAWPRTNTE